MVTNILGEGGLTLKIMEARDGLLGQGVEDGMDLSPLHFYLILLGVLLGCGTVD